MKVFCGDCNKSLGELEDGWEIATYGCDYPNTGGCCLVCNECWDKIILSTKQRDDPTIPDTEAHVVLAPSKEMKKKYPRS